MCGIIGVASNGPMNGQMKEFFADLLFHDVVRGRHATGVAGIDTLDRSLTVQKKAVSAEVFLEDKEMMEPLFAPKHNFNIYIGHNRWATQGAKDDDKNAHPFIHGDLVGVHNGTLRDQKLLDNHKDFVVDSDNLYHHLALNGLDDTVTKLDGAFSLVWYDRSKNTLNFFRNEERPMTIAKLSNGCWVWASERGMLTWLVNRHKTLTFATETTDKVTTQQIWSLDVGLHFSVPYKDKTRQAGLPHAKQYTLPKFVRATTSYYGTGYDSSWRTERTATVDRYSSSTSQTPAFRSDYAKKGDAAVAKWLPGGSQLSKIEVEFLGHYHPKSPSGYEQNISLFLYRNVRGEEITLFCYNHGQNIANQWDEEEDIGRMCYASISSAQPVGVATYDGTRTEGHEYVYVLHELTESPPAAHYAFFTVEEVAAIGAKTMSLAKRRKAKRASKEGDTGSVLPFQRRNSTKQSGNINPSSVDNVKNVKGIFALIEQPGEKIMLSINNDTLSLPELKEILAENHSQCCNCARLVRELPLLDLNILEYYDREEGTTSNFLTCSRNCHNEMGIYASELDAEFEKKLGKLSDD